MVARVTLEIALRKEFDYAIPAELADRIEVGSRVKVPFGHREVPGVVTAVLEESTHTNLRVISKIIGQQSPITAKVLADDLGDDAEIGMRRFLKHGGDDARHFAMAERNFHPAPHLDALRQLRRDGVIKFFAQGDFEGDACNHRR